MKMTHTACLLWGLVLTMFLSLAGPSFGQANETPLRAPDAVRITITGVPPGDQASMAQNLYPISDDGTIRIQHLTTGIRAAGLTPTVLARNIEAAYKAAKIYTNPAINVTRSDDARTVQTVTVSGNVRVPGSTIYRPGMKINDAISEKGGPDDFANMKRVRLVRNGRTTEMDLSNISSHPERDVPLKPGDSIFVPKGGIGPFGR